MVSRDWSGAARGEVLAERRRRRRLGWVLGHPLGGRDRCEFAAAVRRVYSELAAEVAERVERRGL